MKTLKLREVKKLAQIVLRYRLSCAAKRSPEAVAKTRGDCTSLSRQFGLAAPASASSFHLWSQNGALLLASLRRQAGQKDPGAHTSKALWLQGHFYAQPFAQSLIP